jgi:tRNA(His) 5'-end guanylyltransferase
MSNKDSLGDRIKTYENVSRIFLTRRTPVIIRVDGKAFSTLTKKCDKPYDKRFMDSMLSSAVEVSKKIQGFKIAYVQSDEASFLITDYENINSQGWFNYNPSKIISVSASIMTINFNNYFFEKSLSNKIDAVFDSRAFNIPERDIPNYFIWRAKDWERNSLQMYCRSFFSHKELNNKNKEQMHEMLHKIGKNWTTDCSSRQRNGTFIIGDNREINSSILPNYAHINSIITSLLQKKIENN